MHGSFSGTPCISYKLFILQISPALSRSHLSRPHLIWTDRIVTVIERSHSKLGHSWLGEMSDMNNWLHYRQLTTTRRENSSSSSSRQTRQHDPKPALIYYWERTAEMLLASGEVVRTSRARITVSQCVRTDTRHITTANSQHMYNRIE